MKFEINELIKTKISQEDLLLALENQFKKKLDVIHKTGQTSEISLKSFISTTTAIVSTKKAADGILVIIDVDHNATKAYWIALILTFFTGVLWTGVLAFYVFQKNSVQGEMMECIKRVTNEFGQSTE